MRTQFIFIALIVFFKFLQLNGQPTELFWGSANTDFATKIIKLNDGSLMTAGTKRVGQKYQINLTKLSEAGNIIWEKTYPSEDWETANFIATTSDGGFILTGAWYDFPLDTSFSQSSLLVVKLDSIGNITWRASFPDKSPGYCALENSNHEFLIGTVNDPPGTSEKAEVVKLSAGGSLIWYESYTFKQTSRLKQIFPAPGGGYFIVGRALANPFSGVFFAKITETGHLSWSKYENAGFFSEGNGLWSDPLGAIQLQDNAVVIAFSGGAAGFYEFQTSIIKFSASGNLLWKRAYNNAPDESNIVYDIQLCPDGKRFLVSGESGPNSGPNKGFAMMVDTAGYEYWRETYGDSGDNRLFSALCPNDSSLIFVGTSNRAGNGGYDQWLLKTDYEGNLAPYTIGGKIWVDMNNNCSIDSIDLPARFWPIKINDQNYVFTDADGHYEIKVNAGNYTLYPKTQSSVWGLCTNDFGVAVNSFTPNLIKNFLLKPEQNCSNIELGITTPDLVRCDTSAVFVTWSNTGILAEQAQVLEIKLDESLTIIDASEPYIQDGQYVIFEIGDINKFESGTIRFNVKLECNVPLGATHCIEARLKESTVCPPIWSGPFLSMNGECGADSVRFVLSNIGNEPMAFNQQFRLFEDGILVQNADFVLTNGDSIVFKTPANGRTMRLETDQVAGSPNLSWPSVTIEGCGLDENGFASTGVFSIFQHDEGSPNVSFACVKNTTNGIPNKIVEQPEGYGWYHFVNINAKNEYVIRFKNPYPDYVDEVRIRLKLSTFLDLSTFKMTAWSHPYLIKMLSNGDVEIILENADIPPSDVGHVESYCFLRFQIDQLPDVPDQSFITNKAEAYFDFRGPLMLLESWHNIYSNFVATSPSVLTKSPESYQYGDRSGLDFGLNIAESSDGDIYLVGSTLSFNDNYDGFIVKTDLNGKGIWYNAYDVDDGNEIFYAAAPTLDGGCIVAGTYEEAGEVIDNYNGYDILVARIDANGEMLWHKRLRLSSNRGGVAADMITTLDGNFVITGYCHVGGGFGNFLMKIDQDGQVIWSNSYSYPYDEQIFTEQVINTPDGGFLITGDISQFAWEPDIFIQKINSNGFVQWSKSITKDNVYGVTSAAVASDNNFVLVGTIGVEDGPSGYVSTPYLLKIDNSGNEIWEKYPYVGKEDRAKGKRIIPSPDNGFYVLGLEYDSLQLESDLMIIKYNANGDTIWTKSFDTGTDNEPRNLILTSNNKVMTISYSQPNNWLYDIQTLLLVTEHTNNPSTDSKERLVLENNWQVSPNPSTGNIWLFNPAAKNDVNWKLYNANGTQIKKGKFSSNRELIDCADVPVGLYYLNVLDEDNINAIKVLITR